MVKNIEEREEAFQVLIKYGLLVKLEDIELYHGRTNVDGGVWQVESRINNSSNSTNHQNMNAISALNAGSKEVAEKFARSRSVREGGVPEVHKIVATPNSYIVSNSFDIESLPDADKKIVRHALSVLTNFSVSKLSPAKFEEREYYVDVFKYLNDYWAKNPTEYLSYDYLKGAYREYISTNFPNEESGSYVLNTIKNIFVKISGAINSRTCCQKKPWYIINKFAIQKDSKFRNNMLQGEPLKGVEILFPLNMQYIASWLSANGIVGICGEPVNSATIGEQISPYYLFDLENIETEKQEGDRLQEIINEFGAISQLLSNVAGIENLDEFLRNATPEELVDEFRKDKELSNLYGKVPENIWEGFTVGEHTETVLRGFESTYEEKIPSSLHPFIKLTMLAHDLGKGTTERRNEKVVNAIEIKKIFNRLKVPENIQKLMDFVINESQIYTTAHYVKKDPTASQKLRTLCGDKLQELFGESSEGLVTGLVRICEILQTCDSGAYTRYGITRDEKTGLYYYNGNDNWTRGFESPSDLAGRSLHFKEPEM